MKIKRILALLLALAMIIALCACADDSKRRRSRDDDDDDDKNKYVKCTQCGDRCDADDLFCSSCGERLNGAMQGNGNENLGGESKETDNSIWGDESQEDGSKGDGGFNSDEYADVDCYECYDAGYSTCQGHDCYMCEGRGGRVCGGCNGKGYFGSMVCVGCEGDGEMYCFTCSGTGTIYHKYTELPDSVEPSTNSGESKTKCDECDDGFVTCFLCEGTGHFGEGNAPSYGGSSGGSYDKLCPQCQGAKKLECGYCGGDGIRGD